jgi:shikimate dehydrogenase
MSGRYALVGQPVAHSLSPRIHAAFGAQCSIAVEYGLIDVAPDGFDAAVAAFAKAGGAGLNVTLPHKEAARALCATLSERARRCGAVNTLIRGSNGWHGDNTDGAGLVHDLTERHRLDLRARKVLLLGAGGAAHLPGMCASKTALPVLGVPVQSKALNGMDSLLSIVQMPAGVPVATFAIGQAGATNAAIFAASILATADASVRVRLESFRAAQTAKVLERPDPSAGGR